MVVTFSFDEKVVGWLSKLSYATTYSAAGHFFLEITQFLNNFGHFLTSFTNLDIFDIFLKILKIFDNLIFLTVLLFFDNFNNIDIFYRLFPFFVTILTYI